MKYKFDRSKACTSKKAYPVYKEAEWSLKQLRRHGEYIEGLGIYTCNYCHKFHIGHLVKK